MKIKDVLKLKTS